MDITLNMAELPNYEKIENNNKTIILYRKQLDVVFFNHLENIQTVGVDIAWLGIKTNRKIIVVGSGYHNPNKKEYYDPITIQMNRIRRELKHYKKQVIFNINGDFNDKHELWGSSETDDRGEIMLDWIRTNNMFYLNNGEYTYKNANGKKDVLDLILMENEGQQLVKHVTYHTIHSTRTIRTPDGQRKTVPFSDHRGMIITLNLDPIINITPNRITWNFDESKINLFQQALIPKMLDWYNMYEKLKDDPNNLDILVEYFQMSFVSTAQEIFGYKRYSSGSVNWVDKNVRDILIEKKKIRNKISHIIYKMKKHFGREYRAPRHMKKN